MLLKCVAVALMLMAAPAFAGDANESSEIYSYQAAQLPRSEAPAMLALPEPEMEAIAPVSSCRKNDAETALLTN